ncbi:MAG: vitamin K epoxide reductase family protein [Acidimicrobiales bacterium]
MADRRSPQWPGLVGTVASVAGLCEAAYLTYEHYTGSTSLVCADKGIVNCLEVTTSTYSRVAGIPVAVLGLVFFAVMLVLQLPALWRRTEPAVRWARVAWAVVGLGTVVYLLYAELFQIDAICLWCTGVHVLTFILFVSTVFGTLATASFDDGLELSEA